MSMIGGDEGKSRTEAYRRNQSLEGLLQELNSLLRPGESQVEEQFETPRWPLLLIVGPPRSGTTLLLQWLAQTEEFGYPTNLISRFYAAPYIGTKIQRLLTDSEFDFNDEFQDLRQSIDFNSDLGKTQGLLAPNEFWYFWRRFIPNEEPRHLAGEEVNQVNREDFATSLAALESGLGKPLAMKGLILQYNLDVLASMLQNGVVFIHTKRHPFYNIQSLLQARERFYGTRDKWYSAKPKEYKRLKEKTPIEQVAGQIFFTNRAIRRQLEQLPKACSLQLSYESFCRDPSHFYRRLTERLAEGHGLEIDTGYSGPETFESTNRVKVSEQEQDDIIEAWEQFSARELSP